MGSAVVSQLESLLRARNLDGSVTAAALRRLATPRVVSTGDETLDHSLGGGWRRGEVSELVGGRSSGRTTVLVRTLAAAASRGAVVALVDTCDRFDPAAAASAGLDLSRLLWIRGPSLLAEAAKPGLVHLMAHRAVRALDLVVRAGGFAVAALDLADVPARAIGQLPFTTWMRLAHANEGRDTACLLLGDAPMGRSAGGATVRVSGTSRWTGGSPQRRRLEGIEFRCSVASPAIRRAR